MPERHRLSEYNTGVEVGDKNLLAEEIQKKQA
jgi:hypothetical protein